MTLKHIVFDLGGVLIGWQAELAFQHHFQTRQHTVEWMQRIGFADWNLSLDQGRDFNEAFADMRGRHGDDATPLAGYLDHFAKTIAHPVPGTWDIAEQLKANGHRMFAITNWGRETWPAARASYPALTTLFENIVVSGIEGVAKPDPAIFALMCKRNKIAAKDCIFIDDSARNVSGAQQAGMDAIRFTRALALRAELNKRGISTAPP